MDAKFKARQEGVTDKKEIRKSMQNAAAKWLIDKSALNGFTVELSKEEPWLDVYAYQQHLLRKKGNEKIRFSSIDFSGTLIVSDPEKFQGILFSGLGPAKSFGCGLMLVRPV